MQIEEKINQLKKQLGGQKQKKLKISVPTSQISHKGGTVKKSVPLNESQKIKKKRIISPASRWGLGGGVGGGWGGWVFGGGGGVGGWGWGFGGGLFSFGGVSWCGPGSTNVNEESSGLKKITLALCRDFNQCPHYDQLKTRNKNKKGTYRKRLVKREAARKATTG